MSCEYIQGQSAEVRYWLGSVVCTQVSCVRETWNPMGGEVSKCMSGWFYAYLTCLLYIHYRYTLLDEKAGKANVIYFGNVNKYLPGLHVRCMPISGLTLVASHHTCIVDYACMNVD